MHSQPGSYEYNLLHKDAHDDSSQTSATIPQAFQVTPPERSWQPFYLRRLVLAGFTVLFLLLLGSIEVIWVVSNQNHGLATSYQHLHYLWTYGPTAILTLIAAAWARVNFQAKVNAPWLRMLKEPAAVKQTLLLDYFSMFPPTVIVRSIRNRDFLVAATTTNTLVFTLLIVFSTGLITLSPTEVAEAEFPVTVQSEFVNDASKLAYADALPYYTMLGLNNGTLPYPEGSTAAFAYQTINTSLPISAEIQTTVDGLSGGLSCERADITSLGLYSNRGAGTFLDIALKSPSCAINTTTPRPPYTSAGYIARFMPASCGGTSNIDDQRVLLLFAFLEPGNTLPSGPVSNGVPPPVYKNVTFPRSAQLICKPTYNISSVDLVKNGTKTQSVTLSASSSPRTLSDVHPWDIAQAYFATHDNVISYASGNSPQSVNISMTPVNVDYRVNLALGSPARLPEKAESFLDSDYLASYMSKYYQEYIALVTRNSLMQPASTASVGIARITQSRLVVSRLAAQLMVGLLTLAALFAAVAYFFAPRQGFLPRDANTLLGKSTIMVHSRHILEVLRNMGGADADQIAQAMRNYQYYAGYMAPEKLSRSGKAVFTVLERRIADTFPTTSWEHMRGDVLPPTPLRPSVRVIVSVIVVCIVATLEAVLYISNKYDGLGDAGEGAYLHYLWTTVPATLLSLLAMYFASVDFSIRSLTPYSFMKRGAEIHRSINLDLLDLSIPRALYRELRLGAYAAFVSTVTLFATAFLTILTASLFVAQPIAQISSTQLQAVTSFTTNETIAYNSLIADGSRVLPSLVLESNQSFPAFSVGEFSMPGLELPSDFQAGRSNGSSLVFQATVPAIRSKLTCKVYDSSHIISTPVMTLPTNDSEFIAFAVDGEPCRWGKNQIGPNSNVWITIGRPTPEEAYFGGATSSINSTVMSCSRWFYLWGHYDKKLTPNVTSVSAMGCNETFEAVDVAATFLGSDLSIDTSNPPVPIESTIRPTTMADDNSTMMYYQLVDVKSGLNRIPSIFSILTSSRYAVPLSYLGDPARTQEVAEALQFQHKVIRTVITSNLWRVPATASNATLGAGSPVDLSLQNDAKQYTATVTDPQGRWRVVQDPVSTHLLVVLLTGILVLSIISWALMPNVALLPRDPHTIAGAMALLAGGNIVESLPEDAQWLSDEELELHYKTLGVNGFWMGWAALDHGQGSEVRDRFMICAIYAAGHW